MEKIEYLLKNTEFEDIFLKKNKNEYIIKNNRHIPSNRKKKIYYFNGITFSTIINKIKKIISLEPSEEEQRKTTITFQLKTTAFQDKAAYVLLESLIYLMCRDYHFNIKITFDKIKIFNIYHGELKNLLENYKNTVIDKKKYIKEFDDFFISEKRFRKVLQYKKVQENKNTLSILATDLNTFFKTLSLEEEQKNLFIDSLVELVGNASEHGNSDCLLDINVFNNLRKNRFAPEKVGFDIVIYNFSDKLLGSSIQKILKEKEDVPYRILLENALNQHSKVFDTSYTIDDFCNIAAFQWRVSSRKNNREHSGGTGLTTLIQALLQFSLEDRCYVYSGRTGLRFQEKYLKLTSENKKDETFNLVGFNEEADFINYPPNLNCILRSPFFFHGTLYNLMFIMNKFN